jgi:tRNA(adenine34) deaminase
MHRTRPPHARARAPRLARRSDARQDSLQICTPELRDTEGCESGRIGTLGKRVWGNPPWVRIPPPPLSLDRRIGSASRNRRGARADEWGGLESRCGLRVTVGSNPTPSAVFSISGLSDEELMALAIDQAKQAPLRGDVPVGAVVALEGRVVAADHNRREEAGDPTAHAEILALRQAAAEIGSWRLDGVTVAVTLEPCVMCAGALVAARVARVVYGTEDPKAGALGSLYNLAVDRRLNHNFELRWGVLADECAELMVAFFEGLRSSRLETP